MNEKGFSVTNESGFTLIELIVIIVILGILAVTAIPKYIDMQTEAEQAAVDGIAGALAGGSAINYGADLIESSNGVNNADVIELTIANVCTDALMGGLLADNTILGAAATYTMAAGTTASCVPAVGPPVIAPGTAVTCRIEKRLDTTIFADVRVFCTDSTP